MREPARQKAPVPAKPHVPARLWRIGRPIGVLHTHEGTVGRIFSSRRCPNEDCIGLLEGRHRQEAIGIASLDLKSAEALENRINLGARKLCMRQQEVKVLLRPDFSVSNDAITLHARQLEQQPERPSSLTRVSTRSARGGIGPLPWPRFTAATAEISNGNRQYDFLWPMLDRSDAVRY